MVEFLKLHFWNFRNVSESLNIICLFYFKETMIFVLYTSKTILMSIKSFIFFELSILKV